jgi:hypothetical protein
MGGSLPLQGFITGKKSFSESLKTDGSPIEQRINRGVLKAFGDGGGGGSYYNSKRSQLYNPNAMMAQQNQMLQNMQAQQRAKLTNMRSQPALAQSKIDGTNVPADLPSDYKPMQMPKIAQTNTFQMPNMSNLTFGGV